VSTLSPAAEPRCTTTRWRRAPRRIWRLGIGRMMGHRRGLEGKKQRADLPRCFIQTTISGKYNIIEHEVS
jgi:hypothetical protein